MDLKPTRIFELAEFTRQKFNKPDVLAGKEDGNWRTYSADEEATFVSMVNDGAFVEAIAEALGRSVNSIRGKALSLLRSGDIDAIPRQENTKGASNADPLADIIPPKPPPPPPRPNPSLSLP